MNFASYGGEMMMDPVMCCPPPQHREKVTAEKGWWELILIPPSILQQLLSPIHYLGSTGLLVTGSWGLIMPKLGRGWLNKCVFPPGGGWGSHRISESQSGLVRGM